MDGADGYVPFGKDSGTAHVLVHSRLEDRLEVGWLGVLAVAPEGDIHALWTGHEYVEPSPAHVVGWRLNQTQRYHVLRRGGRDVRALLLAQNCHRQEQQSIALLAHEPGDSRLRAAWAAERVIPAGRSGGRAWQLHHGDRYHLLGGHAGEGPIRLLARRQENSSLGVISLDEAKGGLVTDWVGGASVPPRSGGAPGWVVGPGDRIQALPSFSFSGRPAVLVQSRDSCEAGHCGLAVLSCDPAGAGLALEWSADAVLSGQGGARWLLRAGDRHTVAGSLGRPQRCTLIIQGHSADPAGTASLAVVSVEAGDPEFRLNAVARGCVPPRFADCPAWRLDHQDKLHVLGRFSPAGSCTMLVHRRVRDRSERQRLGLLSYNPANGGLLTDWIAGDELDAPRSRSPGWQPDPLDRFCPLGDAGVPGAFRMLVQSRKLGDPDRSRVGVLSYRASAAGLITERIFRDTLPPWPFQRP